MRPDTIPARLFEQAKRRPHDPAYYVRQDGRWVGTSWATFAQEVETAARALLTLGFQPGQTVCILGFNRPEWTVFDVATMAVGGAPAGIYTTSSAEQVKYIVGHAESPFVLVENQEQWAKIQAVRADLPALRHVIAMKGAGVEGEGVLSWEAFCDHAEQTAATEVERCLEALKPDQLATLIYTSGTTGPPKGVMLSHDNLSFTSSQAAAMLDLNASLSTLSYLPLSHIAEQVFTIHGPITAGYPVYYAESMEKLKENLVEVQPSVFFGVPRVWEKMYAGIQEKLKGAQGAKKHLVHWAMGVGREVTAARNAGREPNPWLALQYKLARKLIFDKVKQAIGFGSLRYAVSGAAPIAAEVLAFFSGLDIIVHEVYGQSENCGPTSFNLPGATRYGTVGRVFPGGEIKLAPDASICQEGEGEICYRGRNVFLGYFKNEAATAETIVDGWLHSGDIGKLDGDGFLTITGRKKEILITAGGKNIAPKNIEAALKNIDLINEAVVIGDRRKFLSALLTLDPEASERFAKEQGIPVDQLATSDALRAYLQPLVDEINRRNSRVEEIKRFTVLPRNLSMDEGELTPTLKVKRNVVNDHFAKVIDAMYEDGKEG